MTIKKYKNGKATVYEFYFESDRVKAESQGKQWQPNYVCYIYD